MWDLGAQKVAILEAPCAQNAPGRSTMRPSEALLPRNPTNLSSHFSRLTLETVFLSRAKREAVLTKNVGNQPAPYHPHRNNYKRKKNKNPGILDFLSVGLRKRKRNKKILGFCLFFVSVACSWGVCVTHMFITKANAKENLEELIFPFHYESESEKNLQIFICNHICADGTRARKKTININILGGTVSGTNRNLQSLAQDKLSQTGPFPGTNRDPSLGQTTGNSLIPQ